MTNIGTVMYYYKTGSRLKELDINVPAAYAESASRAEPHLIVEWLSNHNPADVRSFHGGRMINTPPPAQTSSYRFSSDHTAESRGTAKARGPAMRRSARSSPA